MILLPNLNLWGKLEETEVVLGLIYIVLYRVYVFLLFAEIFFTIMSPFTGVYHLIFRVQGHNKTDVLYDEYVRLELDFLKTLGE